MPPYFPDLNPIEQDFAALKKRREYQEYVTIDDLPGPRICSWRRDNPLQCF